MDKKDKASRAREVLPGLKGAMESCTLCGRKCKVNRIRGEKGACMSGVDPVVYSSMSHHGEEPPLSGKMGSGTIFFSGCPMKCVYCQNFRFSQSIQGKEMSPLDLAEVMLRLQDRGCHNINLVTPGHFVAGIVEALGNAHSRGLEIPVVYNTSGYDDPDVISKLEGLVDIYLADMRYSSDEMAVKYSSAPGYVENNRSAVLEMARQVGPLEIADGIARKGLIIRLLILPGGISGTEDSLKFISSHIGRDTFISLMSQYYPAYKASAYGALKKRISLGDYTRSVDKMDLLGMNNGWVQPFGGAVENKFSGENLLPDT
jgi:putative pyruvate formate lyase activating enzyme